jgi:energy-coupling factor transporter ATP-binding protein EcfA2
MSPVEKIAEWIKSKPEWWQHSMRLSLKNGALSQADLDEIYKVALVEHGILENEEVASLANQIIDISGFGEELAEVTLKSIEDVINVGALAENQKLEFSKKGLTIIYGDNGAGKSSYARILKHACLSRGGSPQILGNVFTSSEAPSSAKIATITDEKEETKDWSLTSVSCLNLKSIRVFDNDVAEHFVTSEDELGYKPSGLHILEDLAEMVNFVNRQVMEEIMPGNGFIDLPIFADTEIGNFINKLSSNTNLLDVDQLVVSDKVLGKIETLSKEIHELKSKSPKQLRKEISDKKQQITPLKVFITNSIKQVNSQSFIDIKDKELDFFNKNDLAKNLKIRVLSGLPISGVGGEKWQSMWIAAEKYLISTGGNISFPPKQKESCPLCIQTINEDSAKKLAGFSEFMANEAIKDAAESKKILELCKKEISDYDFSVTPYEATIALVDENIAGFSDTLSNLFNELNSRKLSFTSDTLPEKIEALSTSPLDNITTLIDSLGTSLDAISKDGNNASLIQRKEKEHLELLDQKVFKENLPHIKSNINRYKLVAKYNKLQHQCKSRPITDLNSDICKQDVIAPLVKAFEDELQKFGFNRFKVSPKTRGRSGAQLLKLEILSSGEPLVSKVASEGEQRCISISCFLAEMRADKRKSAVIFDDPVNSLSHQWSSRVAKRLVEESLHRQVIVLTHDIVFYKLLLEEIESTPSALLSEICLERSRKEAGIVRATPPWDALTTGKRIKQLQVKLRELRKIEQEETENNFKQAAYNFYGFLREAWERLVEEKLLNQVVTRFGRAIQTTRLKKLVDLTNNDFIKIESAMSKCSAYFRGHDSAPAIGDPYPTILEIEEDLRMITEFNDELQNIRNRS